MRRGFTLTETLVGLTISAVLLAGLCAAIQASVDAIENAGIEPKESHLPKA